MPNGVILVNKPTGMSSNTLVKKVGKILGEKKVGHMGTLDPMGSGLLPVLCGKSTRLFDLSTNKTKTYRAVFKFGVETDTLDSEGQIVKRCNKVVDENQLRDVLDSFVGEFDQLPPIYSSKKINGKKAYELARGGMSVQLSPKRVTISKLNLIKQLGENTFLFEIECSQGTYIRSICRDVAAALSTCGTMVAICRTGCCGCRLSDSLILDEIDNSSKLILSEDFIDLPSVFISKENLDKLKNGIKVNSVQEIKGEFKLFCGDIFWGVAKVEQGYYKILRNFFGG